MVNTLEAVRDVDLEDLQSAKINYEDVEVGLKVMVRQVIEVVTDDQGELFDASGVNSENIPLQRTTCYSPREIEGEVIAKNDDSNGGYVFHIRPFNPKLPVALVPASKKEHWVGTRLSDTHPKKAAAGRMGHFATSYEFKHYVVPKAGQPDQRQQAV